MHACPPTPALTSCVIHHLLGAAEYRDEARWSQGVGRGRGEGRGAAMTRGYEGAFNHDEGGLGGGRELIWSERGGAEGGGGTPAKREGLVMT